MKTRFNEAQIIGILQEQEAGAKVADTCRRHAYRMRHFTTRKVSMRHVGLGSKAVKIAGRREPPFEEACNGLSVG